MLTGTYPTSRVVVADDLGATSARDAPATRSWRYARKRRSRKALALALLTSAGLHAFVLFGLGRGKKAAPRRVEGPEVIALTIAMPELKEDEPEAPPGGDGGEAPDLGSLAPVQADVPQLPRPDSFVQPLDLASLLPRPDLAGAKTLTIPEDLRNSGKKIAEGMGAIFNLADVERAPEPLIQIAPPYPAKLKQKGEEGIVRVEFVVDTQGRVVSASVFESTNHGFDVVTLATVAKWRFRPGLFGGRPVNTRMRVPIAFSLRDPLSDLL